MMGKNKKLIIVVTDEGDFRLYCWKEEVLPKYEIVKFDGMSSKNLSGEQDVSEYVDNIVQKLGYYSSTQVQVLFVFEKENKHFVDLFYSEIDGKFQVASENFIIDNGKFAHILKSYGVQIEGNCIKCNDKQYHYLVLGGKNLILDKGQGERKLTAEFVPKANVVKDFEEKKRKVVKPPILKETKAEKKIDLSKLPPVPIKQDKDDGSGSMTHEEAQDLWDRILADDSDE